MKFLSGVASDKDVIIDIQFHCWSFSFVYYARDKGERWMTYFLKNGSLITLLSYNIIMYLLEPTIVYIKKNENGLPSDN